LPRISRLIRPDRSIPDSSCANATLEPGYPTASASAVLAIPLAYLLRLGRARGFEPHELVGIGLACLLILIFILPFVKVPVGFIAVVIVAALIARRARTANAALSAT